MGCGHEYPCIGDTFFEQNFYKKCQMSSLGNDLWSDWLYNKHQYEERTKTTVYEFMNYSRHDTSHSVNILKAIERILGKDRVELLGLGDMWLILNAAYAHDIGMATEYSELKELWKDKDFLDYVEKERDSADEDSARSARHYAFLDAFIKKQKGISSPLENELPNFEWDDYDAWPLEFRKEITLLMAEYIRPRHGERSENFFKSRTKTGNILLNDRLNNALGRIVALHMEDQENIKQLNRVANGFCDDDVHPQFIAVLLRVGDLLDLDNNRFDIFTLKHYGKLPHISALHYMKHQAVEHLLIQPDRIEVTACSDDFEVCQISMIWFDSLKNEIINMITRWKEIAPPELTGCRMGLPELRVLQNNMPFENNHAKKFDFDTKKILDLFTGNNLYDSNLAFIREYVQNAFDALRIQLWKDLDQESKKRKYIRDSRIKKEDLKPIDLTKKAYDDYPVTIYIREYRDARGIVDQSKFVLEIEDVGIGIDENGINSIAHIGSGWRERTNFTDTIRQMRQWFRPTGGFGIGMQSAFMITDKVEIYTKAADSSGYQITVMNKGKPNNILVKRGQNHVAQGTKVHLVIELAKLSANEKILEYYGKELNKEDLFDYDNCLENVYRIIKEYVKEMFPNSLFPITVRLDGRNSLSYSIQSEYFFAAEYPDGVLGVPPYMDYYEIVKPLNSDEMIRGILQNFISETRESGIFCDKLFLYFNEREQRIRIWDDATETFYYMDMANEQRVQLLVNYKNVNVTDDSKEYRNPGKTVPYIVNVILDVMGSKVEDTLLVSRNHFKAFTLLKKFYQMKYARAYLRMMMYWQHQGGSKLNMKRWFEATLICNYVFPEEDYEKDKDALEANGVDVWVIREQDLSIRWIRSYYLYYHFYMGLLNRDIILAIPDETGHINYEVDEGNPAAGEFRQKLVIINDPKTISVLRYYLDEENEIVIKRPVLKDTAETGQPDFNAIRIVNKNGIDIQTLSRIQPEQKMDVNTIRDSRAREYKLVTEVPVGQEALVVKQVPFIPAESNKMYIISPYSREVDAQINRLAHSSSRMPDKDMQFTPQGLVDIVFSSEQFEVLCKWVYEHQIDERKYNLEDIRQAYRQILLSDFPKFEIQNSKFKM